MGVLPKRNKKYKKKNVFCNYLVPTCDFLKEIIKTQKLTMTMVSEVTKIPIPVLLVILDNKHMVTKSIADKLAKLESLNAKSWLAIERGYRKDLKRLWRKKSVRIQYRNKGNIFANK